MRDVVDFIEHSNTCGFMRNHNVCLACTYGFYKNAPSLMDYKRKHFLSKHGFYAMAM